MKSYIEVKYEGNTYTTPTAHRMIAVKMLNDYCKKYKYNYKDIIGRDRLMEMVERRARIARHLMKTNLSLAAVAYALNKDRSTVRNYRDKFSYLDGR